MPKNIYYYNNKSKKTRCKSCGRLILVPYYPKTRRLIKIKCPNCGEKMTLTQNMRSEPRRTTHKIRLYKKAIGITIHPPKPPLVSDSSGRKK